MSICRYYEILVYSRLAWFTAVAVKAYKLVGLNLEKARALKDIAVLVAVSFVLSLTVAGASYILLNWIL